MHNTIHCRRWTRGTTGPSSVPRWATGTGFGDIHIYIYIYHLSLSLDIYIYIMCAYYIYIYIYIYIRLYLSLSLSIYIYIYIHMCIYTGRRALDRGACRPRRELVARPVQEISRFYQCKLKFKSRILRAIFRLLRSTSVLRFWISEGLTQAES